MSISLTQIVSAYANRGAWSDAVCGYTLSDGTRVIPTKAGCGIRIFRPGHTPHYAAFADGPSVNWSKRYPI